MSFVGPEANEWQRKLDKQYYLLRLEATEQIGSLALWRTLEEMNMIKRYLEDHDPNYEENRRIYLAIVQSDYQPKGKHQRSENGTQG